MFRSCLYASRADCISFSRYNSNRRQFNRKVLPNILPRVCLAFSIQPTLIQLTSVGEHSGEMEIASSIKDLHHRLTYRAEISIKLKRAKVSIENNQSSAASNGILITADSSMTRSMHAGLEEPLRRKHFNRAELIFQKTISLRTFICL